MKNKHSGILLVFFPLNALAAQLTLQETVEKAWHQIPLLSAQLDGQNELYRLSTSDRWRRFLPNEPQIQYANNDNGSSDVTSLVEDVSFPGKAFAFSKLDKAKQGAQLAELRAKKYEIARTMTNAYLNAAVSKELVEQQKRNISDTETVATSLRARYASGMATQAETIVTELQLRQQQADLIALEDKAASAQTQLKRLLQINDQDAIDLDLPDDIDDRVLTEIGDRTADEARAEAAVALAEANRSIALWSQLPDLNLGIARNHYYFLPASPNGQETTRNYSIGIMLPIFFPMNGDAERDRQRNQAKIDKGAAELQMLNARQDCEEAALEYKRSKTRLAELRKKDLPLAEALMESTFSAYKTGKLGIAELVLARKTLMDFRAQDIQLRQEIISAHLRSLGTNGA